MSVAIQRASDSDRPPVPNPDAIFQFEVAASVGGTTTVHPATEKHAGFIGGFVAGEGTFFASGKPPKFVFAVGLGASDSATCELLAEFFGVGHIHRSPRRKPHYDDEVTFAIQSIRDHLDVTIPFMDAHLPESHKRTQYLAWRAGLLDYWEHGAKRRRPCTVEGCEQPRRAHGYCRRHLWVYLRQ